MDNKKCATIIDSLLKRYLEAEMLRASKQTKLLDFHLTLEEAEALAQAVSVLSEVR